MIWMRELIGQKRLCDLPSDHIANLCALHHKMNIVRAMYGKPLVVTSGYRTAQDHYRIYAAKGNLNPPMGSQHLIGAALDVADPNHVFRHWVVDNLELIERLDLYLESFDATPAHVHIQIYAPRSGNRFFMPF